MAWRISFDPRAERDLSRLDRSVQRSIIRYLETRIATSADPESLGKPLSGAFAGLWRYRLADHRIVCLVVPRTDHRCSFHGRPSQKHL